MAELKDDVDDILHIVKGVGCFAAMVLLIVFGDSCGVSAADVERTLRDEGAATVRAGEPAGGCARGDLTGRAFEARMNDGRVLRGVVCCGLAKDSCYVRH